MPIIIPLSSVRLCYEDYPNSYSSSSDVASDNDNIQKDEFVSAKSVVSKTTFYTAASLDGFGPRPAIQRLEEYVQSKKIIE
jgi:hypothetical protein